jgi:hypothetical protein
LARMAKGSKETKTTTFMYVQCHRQVAVSTVRSSLGCDLDRSAMREEVLTATKIQRYVEDYTSQRGFKKIYSIV